MNMATALEIINRDNEGFMVHFEKVERGMLYGDYFPEKHQGEELIKTEDEAWELAKLFAKKTKGSCINIYVIGSNFKPVPDYNKRTISNR